tara:strand:- start:259 stop:678 length:420 start_codon:yes stop_codon:yes gene_type:complete
MSILNKLRDLVAAMESGEKEESSEDIKDIIDQISESQMVENEKEEEIEELPPYIECSVEETKAVLLYREHAKNAKTKLAELLIDFEKKKNFLLQEVAKGDSGFYKSLNDLREAYGIQQDDQYSVLIPDSNEGTIAFEKE